MTLDEIARRCRNNSRARRALRTGRIVRAVWYIFTSDQRFEVGRAASALRIPSHF